MSYNVFGWSGVNVCPNCGGTGTLDGVTICPNCNGKKFIRNKFNNTRTEYNGIKYDSKKEAAKAAELDLLKQGGEVLEWLPHPRYILQPRYRDKNGVVVRAIYYIPDFWVKYSDGKEVVIDIKGFQTQEFKLKAKMWRYRYRETGMELIIEK